MTGRRRASASGADGAKSAQASRSVQDPCSVQDLCNVETPHSAGPPRCVRGECPRHARHPHRVGPLAAKARYQGAGAARAHRGRERRGPLGLRTRRAADRRSGHPGDQRATGAASTRQPTSCRFRLPAAAARRFWATSRWPMRPSRPRPRRRASRLPITSPIFACTVSCIFWAMITSAERMPRSWRRPNGTFCSGSASPTLMARPCFAAAEALYWPRPESRSKTDHQDQRPRPPTKTAPETDRADKRRCGDSNVPIPDPYRANRDRTRRTADGAVRERR